MDADRMCKLGICRPLEFLEKFKIKENKYICHILRIKIRSF
jgi:hypothetical protein